MKVLFVRPRNPNALVIIPPLNIGYLAAALRKSNSYNSIHIDFIDAQRYNLSPQYVADAIKFKYKPTHVCISCISYEYEFVKQLLPLISYPCIIVIGGVHPTIMPHEVLNETKADYVVIGEGEDIISDIINGNIKRGIIDGGFAKDIDLMPNWELIYDERYPDAPWGALSKAKKVFPIITSRGCPYHCTFCASPMLTKGKIRFRNPVSVVNEMSYLLNRYGAQEFNIQDDNFTLNKSHAAAICDKILSANLKISFTCENGIRADKVDKEIMLLMKKAGCYRVSIGVESADPVVLERVKKHETIEEIERGIAYAKEAGMEVRGLFIFGLPGETKASIKKTIDWAASSNLDEANFNILTVIPGCEIWSEMKDSILVDKPFKTVQYIPEGLTESDIIKAQRDAFWKFYFAKPKRAIRSLTMLRPSQLTMMIRRIKDYHIA